MKVENGYNVQVHYKGTLNDGTEFDNSRVRGQTMGFQVGSGKLIRGFNDALLGMTPGQVKVVNLPAAEAYGHHDPDALQVVPKEAFGEGFVFKLGEMVQGNGPRGTFLAKIEEVRDSEVVLDFNHPLAGQDLTFEIELVSIESQVAAGTWNKSMKKAELFAIAKQSGLKVNTKTTKAQLISALEASA
tara:strand:+ start:530 stop:1090 length:561 start_codon:yes stop_codon:yes gene_type:complete